MIRPTAPWQRIEYRHEPADVREDGIAMTWILQVAFPPTHVVWGFHPHLPPGVPWKKGDESGLGSDHLTDGSQPIEEFLAAPREPLTPEVLARVRAAIDRARREAGTA